jgi:NAD(P)-dependent dehydrogenase (short-subunit alcohol dehydrogenase family)
LSVQPETTQQVDIEERISVEHRNATAAVIGAGDYIGAAIAKKFAAEGFTVFAGRRSGDRLAPLVADVEAQGGESNKNPGRSIIASVRWTGVL